MDLYLGIASRVRELRMARGWSQSELASVAGLTKETISRIERGERSPRLDTLEEIALALDLPLKDLINLREPVPAISTVDIRTLMLKRLLDPLDPKAARMLVRLISRLVRLTHPS